MRISKTELDGVLLIKLDIFKDHRGNYIETYNEQLYAKHNINVKFIQDDIAVSKKNVLRGIHGDYDTWKLISCLYGKFYFVVINCEATAKNFGNWQSFILSDTNGLQILVPPKYGSAHLALSDKVIFHYKQSTYYNPQKQFTYRWNDIRFNITWPITKPILSRRDQLGR